ncbi:MAG: anaerobic ribonucleoside-triphosphate reductase activating protein [Candidatus Aminicenantes bacterium]|nr:anaerobic ribonucleoside-triphosphate reductase activating protein [Candidatus Aminicenantes bacterium]
MVAIKGLEKFAPKDFPGFIASTVFLAGCNFRCPYCHNPDLILQPDRLADIPMDLFLAYLDARKGWLEGVCVTGGEPLLTDDLEGFLSILKAKGLLVKLDTNGSRPDRLRAVLEAGLADRVALDVKAPPERYREVTGAKSADPEAVAQSAEVLRASGLPYLLRTTVVPGLIDASDIEAIGRWMLGAAVFQIQQFSPVNAMDEDYRKIRPYGRDEVRRMAAVAEPYFGEVRIEGI